MSTSPYTRRRLGRAPSPPTWAWYEQISAFEADESDTDSCDDESCSEDGEDYGHRERELAQAHDSDLASGEQPGGGEAGDRAPNQAADAENGSVKMEVEGGNECTDDAQTDAVMEAKKDVKGKQRAVEPEVEESPRRRERRKKQREPVFTLRPILTIQKSQGFVWNQDLFVPPYIKDRYVASTSPPNPSGFVAPTSNYNDYEVEVVEIRVEEGEFSNIIP